MSCGEKIEENSDNYVKYFNRFKYRESKKNVKEVIKWQRR